MDINWTKKAATSAIFDTGTMFSPRWLLQEYILHRHVNAEAIQLEPAENIGSARDLLLLVFGESRHFFCLETQMRFIEYEKEDHILIHGSNKWARVAGVLLASIMIYDKERACRKQKYSYISNNWGIE